MYWKSNSYVSNLTRTCLCNIFARMEIVNIIIHFHMQIIVGNWFLQWRYNCSMSVYSMYYSNIKCSLIQHYCHQQPKRLKAEELNKNNLMKTKDYIFSWMESSQVNLLGSLKKKKTKTANQVFLRDQKNMVSLWTTLMCEVHLKNMLQRTIKHGSVYSGNAMPNKKHYEIWSFTACQIIQVGLQ